MHLFKRMNGRFEEDIAALENQIAEADVEKLRLSNYLSSQSPCWWTFQRPGQDRVSTKSKEFKMYCFRMG
jgi:hypothetical protein